MVADASFGWRLLRSSAFILTLSLVLGLGFPGLARYSEPIITPALLLMMSFSLTEIKLRERTDLRGAMLGFSLNYVLLSGLILALANSLEEGALRYGFVVIAAVPPAVAVLPLTRLLEGDSRLSLYTEVICYTAALILMPGMIFLFTSRAGVSITYLIEIVLLMILLPTLASRYLRHLRLDPVLPINLGFFLVSYTVIGLNCGALFGNINEVALIAFARTFVIGAAVYFLTQLAGAEYEKRISYTLFGSYKNTGLAAIVSVMLFGPAAGIPAAVCMLAETGFNIFLAIAHDRGILK